MRRVALASLLVVAACRNPAPPPALPQITGAVVFTAVELPEAGTVFGGHFAGAGFDVRQFGYQLTEPVRQRWGLDARRRGEAILRGAGLRVRAVGPASSDAQQLRGVQYGLSGRVTELAVRSFGPAEPPYRVEATVAVSWELLDLGSGSAVYGHNIRHVLRDVGAVDTIVGAAIDTCLLRLLADSSFRVALGRTRADPDEGAQRFTRADPGRRDTIFLRGDEINRSRDSSMVGRVAAGLVTLFNPNQILGSAFVVTRDGLALTTARAVRDTRRLKARMASGIERPVRVLRSDRRLDVALVQVACQGDCETVDWDVPLVIDVYTHVMAVGAPLHRSEGIIVAFGRVGGRWGIHSGLTLDVQDDVLAGGEPVAKTTSGRVFAMVAATPGRRPAILLLSEVFSALRIRAAS